MERTEHTPRVGDGLRKVAALLDEHEGLIDGPVRVRLPWSNDPEHFDAVVDALGGARVDTTSSQTLMAQQRFGSVVVEQSGHASASAGTLFDTVARANRRQAVARGDRYYAGYLIDERFAGPWTVVDLFDNEAVVGRSLKRDDAEKRAAHLNAQDVSTGVEGEVAA